jgi:flagellar biosynthesis GTPase FlhF
MTDFQTALEAMSDIADTNKEALWHGPVRFERSAGKFDRNAINLPKFLHELCSTLSACDQHFQFRDKEGNILSMDALPSTQALCESLFNYQVIEQRNVKKMLFVADIISSKPIGQLKNAAWNVLKKYGMWMFRHALSISRLDVGTAGWMLGAHPRYHSPDLQGQMIQNAIEQWWLTLTPDIQSFWKRKYSRYKLGESPFPALSCNPRTIKGEYNGIVSTTTALNIITAAEDTKIINDILTATFPPDSVVNPGIGMYIPMGLRRSNAGHYLRLIQHQQEYLDNYQIVSVAGITREIMGSIMTITTADGTNEQMTVQAAFQLNSSIQRVDPGSYLLRLGKWNVSSTASEAEAAKKWIDTVIIAMPTELRNNSAYAAFPTAARMKAAAQPTTSGYASLAGTYSLDSLKAFQDLRDLSKRTYATTNNGYSQNPQEATTPAMATFSNTPATDTFIDDMLRPASYVRVASSPAPGTVNPGLLHTHGSTRSIASATMPTHPGPSIAQDIAQLKTSIANLQNQSTPPTNTDNTPTSVTPNIMQMFQTLHESMQDSKSAMNNFRQSLESKVHIMEANIQEIQKEHQISNTTAKNFQEEVHLALQSLRTENNELHSRLDSLAQKPVASPRRKKSKDTHKSTTHAKAVPEPSSPESATTTVTFLQPPSANDSDAPTVSFHNPTDDSDMDSETDSDVDAPMLMDPPNLADHADADPLNRTNPMQTDPADPDKDS